MPAKEPKPLYHYGPPPGGTLDAPRPFSDSGMPSGILSRAASSQYNLVLYTHKHTRTHARTHTHTRKHTRIRVRACAEPGAHLAPHLLRLHGLGVRFAETGQCGGYSYYTCVSFRICCVDLCCTHTHTNSLTRTQRPQTAPGRSRAPPASCPLHTRAHTQKHARTHAYTNIAPGRSTAPPASDPPTGRRPAPQTPPPWSPRATLPGTPAPGTAGVEV